MTPNLRRKIYETTKAVRNIRIRMGRLPLDCKSGFNDKVYLDVMRIELRFLESAIDPCLRRRREPREGATTMDDDKRKALEEAGFVFDFLELDAEERRAVEGRVRLHNSVRAAETLLGILRELLEDLEATDWPKHDYPGREAEIERRRAIVARAQSAIATATKKVEPDQQEVYVLQIREKIVGVYSNYTLAYEAGESNPEFAIKRFRVESPRKR